MCILTPFRVHQTVCIDYWYGLFFLTISGKCSKNWFQLSEIEAVFDVYIDVDAHVRLYIRLTVLSSIAFLQFMYCNLADWKHIRSKCTKVSNFRRELFYGRQYIFLFQNVRSSSWFCRFSGQCLDFVLSVQLFPFHTARYSTHELTLHWLQDTSMTCSVFTFPSIGF